MDVRRRLEESRLLMQEFCSLVESGATQVQGCPSYAKFKEFLAQPPVK